MTIDELEECVTCRTPTRLRNARGLPECQICDWPRLSSYLALAYRHETQARITSNEALLRERQAFHERWGSYFKCAACGGRIEAESVDAAVAHTGKPCPHGNHVCAVMQNGYSWTTKP